MSTKTSDLHITRTFEAPIDLVFEAWSKEEHLLEWFGPRSFPVRSWKHDFRPGGSFEFVMVGPGGIEAPGAGEYLEIEAPNKIVVRSQVVDGDKVLFETRQTNSFRDNGDGTTTFSVDVEVVFDDDFPGRAGMEQGWNETLDRLGEFLATRR
jgi:uncharacterized protein YndB with AHSA1/START domain